MNIPVFTQPDIFAGGTGPTPVADGYLWFNEAQYSGLLILAGGF